MAGAHSRHPLCPRVKGVPLRTPRLRISTSSSPVGHIVPRHCSHNSHGTLVRFAHCVYPTRFPPIDAAHLLNSFGLTCVRLVRIRALRHVCGSALRSLSTVPSSLPFAFGFTTLSVPRSLRSLNSCFIRSLLSLARRASRSLLSRFAPSVRSKAAICAPFGFASLSLRTTLGLSPQNRNKNYSKL